MKLSIERSDKVTMLHVKLQHQSTLHYTDNADSVSLIGFVKYTVNDVTSDTLINRHKLQLVVRR